MINPKSAAPTPSHPSHPIPPIYQPPKPIDEPGPPTPPDDDPNPKPPQPVIDPNRGMREPPPVYAFCGTPVVMH